MGDYNNNCPLESNFGDNNHLSSYQYQGKINCHFNQSQRDKNNCQHCLNLVDNNHQQYYGSISRDVNNRQNIRHTGNNNCQTNVTNSNYLHFGDNNRPVNRNRDDNDHQLLYKTDKSIFGIYNGQNHTNDNSQTSFILDNNSLQNRMTSKDHLLFGVQNNE